MARLKIGVIPIEGGHYYREALEEVTRAEELGFDSVWMEEHHAVTDHYWPSPLTVLAGFATRTSRVVLGTDILVAAFYHPVRLAEDVALLDVMSNGVDHRVAADPRRHHRGHGSGGAGARRATHHGRLSQRVRGRLAPPVHRRFHRDRSGQAHGGPLHHRRARALRRCDQAVRRGVRHDPSDLPHVLPRHAAHPHHA